MASNDDVTILSPDANTSHYWAQVLNYKELLLYFCWRDVLVRYKQTILGIAWALIKPFSTMFVFWIIFNKIAKMPTPDKAPYPLLIFTALIPWQFFSSSLIQASESIVGNTNLISKIYFPRIISPLSSIASSLLDSIISMVLLVALMFFYKVSISLTFLFIPLFALLAILLSIGMGLILASLNVFYRDLRHIIPFGLQFGLYISPIGFSSSVIPSNWQFIFSLNPLVGIIEGFRWCTLNILPNPMNILSSILISLLILLIGIKMFRKMENSFSDKL